MEVFLRMHIFKLTEKNKFWLFKAGAFMVVFFYFVVLLNHSLDIPYWDDYVVTLQFLYDFHEKCTVIGKANALLAQWSEHRIVMGRLLALSQYYLVGILNVKILHILANLSLIILFWTILKSSSEKIRKWIVLPVALLLFQLQYYVASFWFVSSSSMFFVLTFSILAFYNLKCEKYLFCIVFSVLAVFSNGNGFLVLIIDILFLLISRKWKISFAFIAVFSLSMLVYFRGYMPHENDRLATFYFLKDPFLTLHYFFSFIGGCFNAFSMAPFIGIVGVLSFSWLTLNKIHKQNPTYYMMMFFVMGSALLAAIGRSFWGVEQALESRYKIFSIVFWICLFLSILELQTEEKRKKIFPWLIMGSLIFNIGSYYKSWPFLVRFIESQKLDYEEVTSGLPRKNLNEAHQILVKSKAKGYY